MLARERHDVIVARVNQNGSVMVKDLAKEFGVTEDSIRKDLTQLEKKGLLKKTYGGAVKIRVNAHEFLVSDRKDKNLEEKGKIARNAEKIVEDGDMIFLDISTCNIELAKILIQKDRDITIVTNMIEIMLLFVDAQVSRVKFIFIGGVMSPERDGFVGGLVNQELDKYHFDKAFVGVVGLDLIKNRVASYLVEDSSTKTKIIASSEKSYLMTENRKLDQEGNIKFAEISDFTGVILNEEPDASVQKQMKKYQIDWIY